MSKVENRDGDIRRTAEEIRLQFLNDHASDGASEFYKRLWRALVNPNLSSTDKVVYALALAERKNFEWSNDRMGKLANVSEVTVKRSFANLETHGFVISRYRGTGKTAHRDFPMPETIRALALASRAALAAWCRSTLTLTTARLFAPFAALFRRWKSQSAGRKASPLFIGIPLA